MANEFLDTNITGDVEIDGPLVLTGLLTAGSGAHVLTTAAGLLAGAKIDPGTVGFAALNTTDFNVNSRSPSYTGVANAASGSSGTQLYYKTGRYVICAGRIDITPTSTTTLTQARFDLPYAANTADSNSLAGMGVAPRGNSPAVAAVIQLDTGTGEALFSFASSGTTSHIFRYYLAYLQAA